MGSAALVIVVGLALYVVVISARRRPWVVVPPGHWAVVERLGRYRRTLTPGRYLLVPTLDVVRALVPMDEQVASFPATPVITADNQTLAIEAVLRYRIVDPVRAVYEVASYHEGLERLTVYALRLHLGGLASDEALDGGTGDSPALLAIMNPRADVWGIRIDDVTAAPFTR